MLLMSAAVVAAAAARAGTGKVASSKPETAQSTATQQTAAARQNFMATETQAQAKAIVGSSTGATAAAGARANMLVTTKAVTITAGPQSNAGRQASASSIAATVKVKAKREFSEQELQLKTRLNQVSQLFSTWSKNVDDLIIPLPSLSQTSMDFMATKIKQSIFELSQIERLSSLVGDQLMEERVAAANTKNEPKTMERVPAEPAGRAAVRAKTTAMGTSAELGIVVPKPKYPTTGARGAGKETVRANEAAAGFAKADKDAPGISKYF